MKTDDKIKLVVDRMTQSQQWVRPLKETWKKCKDLYEAFSEKLLEVKEKGREDKYHIPEPFRHISAIAERIVESYLKTNRFAELVSDENDPQSSEVIDELNLGFKTEVEKIDGIDEVLEIFVTDALLVGSGIVKIGWRKEKRITSEDVVVVRDKVLEGSEEAFDTEETIEHIEKVEIIDEGLSVENVDLGDFFVDPMGKNINDCHYVIHRTYRTLDELKALVGSDGKPVYKNLDQVERDLSPEGYDEKEKQENNPDKTRNRISYGSDKERGYYEILEYWEDTRLIVVAGRKVLLRDISNPYRPQKKPFAALYYKKLKNTPLGFGLAKYMICMSDELDTLRSSRSDARAYNALPIFWDDSPYRGDTSQLKLYPGAILDRKIQAVHQPNVAAPTHRDEDKIYQNFMDLTGITPYNTGQVKKGMNDTASGTSLLISAADRRLNYFLIKAEKSGIRDMFQLFYDRCNQFKFKSQNFIVKVRGLSDMISKQMARQNLMELANFLFNNPIMQTLVQQGLIEIVSQSPLKINIGEIVKHIIEAYEPKNLDEILPK